MNWYKIIIPKTLEGSAMINEIQKSFFFTHMNAGYPKDAALLMNKNADNFNTPTTQIFYFTPAAAQLCADLIRQHNGEPCPEPPIAESNWVAGDNAYLTENRLKREAEGTESDD